MNEPTPVQQGIVWGSKFARPVPDQCCIEFGEVLIPGETIGQQRVAAFDGYEAGHRPSKVYTRRRPEYLPTVRHIGDLAPLTDQQFAIAAAAGWDANRLALTPEGRGVIRAVFTDPAWEGERD